MQSMTDWPVFVDAADLKDKLDDPRLLLLDCRFRLTEPDWGWQNYLAQRIPGARHADLDRDLADTAAPGGRHPLPQADAFMAFLGGVGFDPGRQVVVYDDRSGALAARAWWLIRHLGHSEVSILSGGLQAWQDAGLPVEEGELAQQRASGCRGVLGSMPTIDADQLLQGLESDSLSLVDARAAERFQGEVEPLDARPGHIPGAINRPFSDNLNSHGRLLPADVLHEQWAALLAGRPTPVVHMCGSGVTACHNLAAAAHAGFGLGTLYVGSWSGWIEDQSRPVEGPPGAGD